MAPLLARLDARDRALFRRWLLGRGASRRSLTSWRVLTHAGGARASILAVLLPLLWADGPLHAASVEGAWVLLLSHLVVQVAKRTATRPRPTVDEAAHWHADIPDAFSFPSGHACAAMAVAFTYAAWYPGLAWPLLTAATLVGISRVRLGVHYPGDVLAGQLIAIATGLVVRACN